MREYTVRLLEMVQDGIISPYTVLDMVLNYMSEDDVKDMMEINGLLDEDE